MGLSCALCVGSTMVIAVKQNNWRQSRGSWGTILCLVSSCPGARRGQRLPIVPGTDEGVAAARPMGKRWLCLCTVMIDDLTQQEGICRQR